MKSLLISLIAALSLPNIANAESFWLVLSAASMKSASLEKIEMASMEQCKEQGEIFAIVLILLVLEIMYDSLFIYGILEGWDQQFLSFTLAMAFMIMGLMIDFYRRSFLPDVLELKKRRSKVITKLER